MVQQIETLGKILEKRGLSSQAGRFRKHAQELREEGLTPESLEGVVVYEKNLDGNLYRHALFDHYKLEQRVVRGKDDIYIPGRENQLLTVLGESPNVLIFYPELLERAFGKGFTIGYLRKSVERLRKKLEPNPKKPETILTRRRRGYLFRDPSKEIPLEPSQEVEVKERIHVHPGFTYYPERSMVAVGSVNEPLTSLENKVLGLLMQHANRYVTREMFKREVWGRKDVNSTKVLTEIIKHLRRKIEPGRRMEDYQYILSKYGIGYKLYDPSKTEQPDSVTVFEIASQAKPDRNDASI